VVDLPPDFRTIDKLRDWLPIRREQCETPFSEEQMVAIIREGDRDPVAAVAKRHGISEQTIYAWRKRFGALQANDVKRLRQLEAENARLKKLVAERDLEIEVMKEVAAKNGERAGSPAASEVWPRAWSLGAAGLHAVLGSAINVEVSQPQGEEGCSGGRADDRVVGAVSPLRVSAHPYFSRPRRPCHSPGRRTGCGGRRGYRSRASGRGSASLPPRGHARKRRADRTKCGPTTSFSTIAPTVNSSGA
jgi:putative transposase